MNPDHYRYFLEVKETRSYATAARNLFISPQALNRAIKGLEERFQTKLFERSGKYLHLTDSGNHLAPLAEACTEAHDDLEQSMTEYVQGTHGREELSLLETAYVVSLLNTIQEDVGSLGIEHATIIEESTGNILASIKNDEKMTRLGIINVALKDIPALTADGDIVITPFIRSQVILKGTNALISPRRKYITAGEISSLPIAYFKEAVLESLLKDAFPDSILDNIILQSSNKEMRESLVKSGEAVIFNDTFNAFILSRKDDFIYIPIKDAPSFYIAFVYRNNCEIPDQYSSFMSNLGSTVSNNYSRYIRKFPLEDSDKKPATA